MYQLRISSKESYTRMNKFKFYNLPSQPQSSCKKKSFKLKVTVKKKQPQKRIFVNSRSNLNNSQELQDC